MIYADSLISYIDELINEKATQDDGNWFLSFYDLDDDEQGQLIAFKIKENNYEVYDLYHDENADSSFDKLTNLLIIFLKNNSPFNSECFAQAIRNHAISYYADDIQDQINERCSILRREWIDSRGFNE